MRGHRTRRRTQGTGADRLGSAKSGVSISEEDLKQQLISYVRETIGAITYYKETVILFRLPETRSGKTLRKVVNGQDYIVPSTIDDPGVIQEIIDVLRSKKIVA